MTTGNQHGDRRGGIIAAAAVAAVLAIVGTLVLFLGMRGDSGPSEPPLERALAAAPATTGPSPKTTPSSKVTPTPPGRTSGKPGSAQGTSGQTGQVTSDFGPILPPSDPVGLDIPAIGVRSKDFVALGLNKDGSIEVPIRFEQPGWYKLGPTPGEFGPAVISGHVDSKKGPAVFYRLGELKPGAKLKVTRKDGSVANFAIDRVARYPKDDFPTDLVYGPTKRAEIRLVTCGGAFDEATGHYVDNVVAFGHLST